jgi:copper chaperone CopZ
MLFFITTVVRLQVNLKVDMRCEHCVSNVTKVLSKAEGISKFDISLADKKVTVTSTLTTE